MLAVGGDGLCVNRPRAGIFGRAGADLNQRIEPVRDQPDRVTRFSGRSGLVILRYRVRVLPGCNWVITDHFIPAIKDALRDAQIEPASEPTSFFINRIDTFRKLFSRRLTEGEIVRGTAQDHLDPPPAPPNLQKSPNEPETAGAAP